MKVGDTKGVSKRFQRFYKIEFTMGEVKKKFLLDANKKAFDIRFQKTDSRIRNILDFGCDISVILVFIIIDQN